MDRLRKLFFSEATFHVSRKVNCHNVRIWGTQYAHEFLYHVRDSPKKMFCAVSALKVYMLFFCTERTVTGVVYLEKLQQWLLPPLQVHKADFILQQDGHPTYSLAKVRDYLKDELVV